MNRSTSPGGAPAPLRRWLAGQDRLLGLIVLLVAGFLFVETFNFKTVDWDPLGLPFWPRVLLVLLAVLGIYLVIRGSLDVPAARVARLRRARRRSGVRAGDRHRRLSDRHAALSDPVSPGARRHQPTASDRGRHHGADRHRADLLRLPGHALRPVPEGVLFLEEL